MIQGEVYCIQFFAPSTAEYTHLYLYNGPNNLLSSPAFVTLGAAIYNNSPVAPPYTGLPPPLPQPDSFTTPGIPNTQLGHVSIQLTVYPNIYIPLKFNNPVNLVMDTLYWVVIGGVNTGGLNLVCNNLYASKP